uniref:Uncharacterized protein n=1 Tax=Avena sativa TaxID=4498 RepID=A0ACD5ZFU7_AVESA
MDDLAITMGSNNIADESVVPTSMDYHLLKEMTDGFSENQLLGQGGFGKVYKGVNKDGRTFAVKVLYSTNPDDPKFKRELWNLASVRHENIVRLYGFCNETKQDLVRYNNGNFVFADNIRMALCLEYMPNGSLANYLSDEFNGHDWRTYYRIIKGTCQGLKCLHESNTPILHLDLKLDNILLDEKMDPKIADFGLSRLLGGNLTQVTEQFAGTLGYVPPEFIERGQISSKFDIFSLGVVITNILVGPKGYSETIDMSSSDFIDYVHEIWRNRLEASPFYAADIDLYYEQIKRCSEIALKCVERDRKKRPSIEDIVKMLNVTECMIPFPPTNSQGLLTDQMRPFMSGNIELLDVHPLRLCFPFEPNKLISCPLHVKNKTDRYVAFRCLPETRERCFNKLWQLWDTLPPRSTRTYVVTVGKQQDQPQDVDKLAVMQSCVVPSNINPTEMNFIGAIEETGAKPYQVALTADFSQEGDPTTSDEPIRPEIKMIQCPDDFGDILSMDIHTNAPRILTGHQHGYVAIWDYETQKNVMELKVSEEPGLLHSLQHSSCLTSILASKFMPKNCFAVGDACGYIHVHRYRPNRRMLKILKAHSGSVTSLAIHSSDTLLLSSSSCDGLIKLWDWGAGWDCIGRFKACSRVVMFDPRNNSMFASVSLCGILQIWNTDDFDHPKFIFGCQRHCKVFSVDYFSKDGDNWFIITGSTNGVSHIWDLQTNKYITELKGSNLWQGKHIFHVTKVGVTNHRPPLLITSCHNGVTLFNSTNYGHENKIEFTFGQVYNCVCIKRTSKDSKDRLAIAVNGGIAVMEINHG